MGKIIKKIFVILIIIIGFINCSFFYVKAENAWVDAWDRDRNGIIDDQEQKYMEQGIPIVMPQLDTNRDGIISKDEYSGADVVKANQKKMKEKEKSKELYENKGYEEGKEVTYIIIQKDAKVSYGNSSKPFWTIGSSYDDIMGALSGEKRVFTENLKEVENVKYQTILGWFGGKYDFYRITVKEWYDFLEKNNIEDTNKARLIDGVKSSDSYYIYIEKNDKAIGKKETIKTPQEILSAEAFINKYKDVKSKQYLEVRSTESVLNEVNSHIKVLTDIINSEEYGKYIGINSDEETQLESVGFTGKRIQRDIDYLKEIRGQIDFTGMFDFHINEDGSLSYKVKVATGHGDRESDYKEKTSEKVGEVQEEAITSKEEELTQELINSSGITEQPKKISDSSSSATGIDSIIEAGKNFLSVGEVKTTYGSVESFSQFLVSLLFTAGSFITVLIGIILGIKYLLSSVEDKVEIKKYLVPYIVGSVVIFGGGIIWRIVLKILQQI